MSVRDTREEFRRHIDDAVMVLFALVTESIGWATVALLDQDEERARAVIDGDPGIDDRCEELVGVIKERLSTAMLEPEELENLVAVLQIVPELERSADLAEHIAQRALERLGGEISPRSRGLIQSMSDIAVRMWQTAGTAYRKGSRDAGIQLGDADDELDELASRLVTEGTQEGADPEVAVSLALIARFYERLGDHSVNLARRVDVMAAPRRLSRLSFSRRSSANTTQPSEKRGVVRRIFHGLSRIRVVPSDDAFFELLRAAADNARDCAGALSKLVTATDGFHDEAFETIKGCERR